MKKLLSLALVMTFGVTVALAQSATTTTDTKQVETAAPVIKAIEAEQGAVKCAGTTGSAGSCCSHGSSRSSAATTTTSADGTAVAPEAVSTTEAATTVTTGEVKAESAPACHQVSIGVSAAKPEPTEKTEDPKK